MDSRETKRTVPYPSVGAGGEQPNSQICTTDSISEAATENNPQDESMEDILRELQRTSDPAYLHTVSMNELYRNVYQSRPPIIDGLLYPGTYLFAGAPKVGKSFLMAQLAYHVSMGLPLWGYPVHKGTVLYLALEDDHRRLQGRLYRMFGMDGTNDLLGAADGAFLLQKEKRTDGSAILDVAGRDQQDQRMYLTKDKERLVWELERLETEPWVEPPDPVLEAVAALVTVDRPAWGGTATELAAALQTDMKPNALAMRLNVRAGRLAAEYHIRYENSRSHAGRSITLTLEPPQA